MKLPSPMIFRVGGIREFWAGRNKKGEFELTDAIYGTISKEDYLKAVVTIHNTNSILAVGGKNVLTFATPQKDEYNAFSKAISEMVYEKLEKIDKTIIPIVGLEWQEAAFLYTNRKSGQIAWGKVDYPDFFMEVEYKNNFAVCRLVSNNTELFEEPLGKFDTVSESAEAIKAFYNNMSRAYVRSFLNEDEIPYFQSSIDEIRFYGLNIRNFETRPIGQIDNDLFTHMLESGCIVDDTTFGDSTRCICLDGDVLERGSIESELLPSTIDLITLAERKSLDVIGCDEKSKKISGIISPYMFQGFISPFQEKTLEI